jgi:rsbT co-antagonist protein RsbR
MSSQTALAPDILSKLFERSPDIIQVYDLHKQQIVYANRPITKLLGYSSFESEALLASNTALETLLHEEDKIAYQTQLKRAAQLADEEVLTVEYRFKHKDGSWRWLVTRDAPFERDAKGELISILRTTSLSLEYEKENWSRRILEHIPMLVYVYSLERGNLYANQQLGDMLGYSEAEVQAMGASFLPNTIHPDDFPKVLEMQNRLRRASDDEQVSFTYRIKRGDGEWCVLEDTMRIFERNEKGEVTIYVGATQDVTKRVETEKEREELLIAYEQQQNALRELSTPLIPLSDEVLVLPLIGTIETQRAQQILETLLEGVSSHRVRTVIVDITGVVVVDTQVANVLLRAAQATRLLGAETILTGIRPEVAQTLVQLGADLSGLVTRSTLQSGITYAMGSSIGR